jgi:hypothetical protein
MTKYWNHWHQHWFLKNKSWECYVNSTQNFSLSPLVSVTSGHYQDGVTGGGVGGDRSSLRCQIYKFQLINILVFICLLLTMADVLYRYVCLCVLGCDLSQYLCSFCFVFYNGFNIMVWILCDLDNVVYLLLFIDMSNCILNSYGRK